MGVSPMLAVFPVEHRQHGRDARATKWPKFHCRSGAASNDYLVTGTRGVPTRTQNTGTPVPQKEIAMQVQPYLFLDGRCEEAIEFYKKAIGAEVLMLMRYKDSPEPCPSGKMPPGVENKVMHASVQIGSSTVLLSDGHCQGQPKFQGFSLTLGVSNEAQADRAFAALGEGGQVTMPLGKTFFSPKFGMLTDRFGVGWMVIVETK